MTLTYGHDLDLVKLNQHAKYKDHFICNLSHEIIRTHTQRTNHTTGTTKALKWLALITCWLFCTCVQMYPNVLDKLVFQTTLGYTMKQHILSFLIFDYYSCWDGVWVAPLSRTPAFSS